MTTSTVVAPARGQFVTLAVSAAGAGLAMAVYITPIATLASTSAALRAGPDGQAWILSAMAVGLVLGLLPGGTVGDDRGRRRVFRMGAAGLAAASALAALAPTTAALVAARIGQGLAAAAVLTCSLGLVGHAFPAGPHRVRASGLWGAGLGAGMATGPLLAGGLDVQVGWRGAYWLAAALAATLALVARRVPESWAPRRRPVDVPGMLLLGAALAAVLAGLAEGRTGWDRPLVIVLLVGGLLLGTGFVVVELRRRTPMLDPRLLRRPDFAAATLAAAATGGSVIALLSFLPTLVQRGLGATALVAGLVLLAWSAPTVAVAALARRLPRVAHPRTHLVAGLVVVTVGQVLLTAVTPQSPLVQLLPGLVVAGLGNGVLNAALARQAVASAPAERGGFGSGVNNTARYVGSAIGVTVVVVLAGRPDAAAMVTGWNVAALVMAGVSAAGALAVAACRPRSHEVVLGGRCRATHRLPWLRPRPGSGRGACSPGPRRAGPRGDARRRRRCPADHRDQPGCHRPD